MSKRSEPVSVPPKENNETVVVVEDAEPPPIDPNQRNIKISVEGYRNVFAKYKYSDLSVTARFLNEELGPPQTHPLVPLEFTSTKISFDLTYIKNLSSDLDKLITVPVILTLTELESTETFEVKDVAIDETNHEIEGEIEYEDDPDEIALKEAIKLQEYTQEISTKREDLLSRKTLKKIKKEKQKRVKEIAKGNTKNLETVTTVEEEKPTGPITIGSCSLDLLPFFLGKTEISELLPVRKTRFFSLEDCRSITNTPFLKVTATLDEALAEVENSNIINLSIESMYNLPSLMGEDMVFSMAIKLPTCEEVNEPLLFTKYRHVTKRELVDEKIWYTKPNIEVDLPASKYKFEHDVNAIKNRAKADVLSVIGKDVSRIEWNIIKRIFKKDEDLEAFEKHVRQYRSVLFEIYISPKAEEKVETGSVKGKSKSDKSKGKDKKGKKGKESDATEKPFLHLMAFVDLSSLVYPGIQKCKIACPLKTYHEQEISKIIGEYNSFYRPKKPEVVTELGADSPKKKGKGGAKEGKSAKSPKSEKSGKTGKSGKSGKGGKKDKASSKSKKSEKDGDNNLAAVKFLQLPPEPIPIVIEPSKGVYNENGQPTFLLVEFELTRPLTPVHTIEDLSEQFYGLIPKYPRMAKQVASSEVIASYFQETIRTVIEDLTKRYQLFTEELEESDCQCHQDELALLDYLKKEGVYQTYLPTVQNAVSLYIADKYPELNDMSKNSVEYQIFVSDIYTFLINEMNKIVNIMTMCQIEQPPELPTPDTTLMLFYAKEACELGAYELAKKYHLQRLEKCNTNVDFWFDFAVFHVEINKVDKAMECLKEALALDTIHVNSLILYGCLLLEQKKYNEAETFFLLLTIHEPRLTESWCLLHLFYEDTDNPAGKELCMEMIQKYVDDVDTYENYFFESEDLAWCQKMIPKTPFFRTAMLLLKMRAFYAAYLAITHEIHDNENFCEYLIGVGFYYQSSYQEALHHFKRAKKMFGFNYAIGGIIGHCLMHLLQYEKATEIYERILQDDKSPTNIHLIYIKCAVAYDRLDNGQSARKMLLLACKYNPTPYTWLGAGLMYYKQKDFFSAEACFCQANFKDNLLPEIWAYLALVNLELDKRCEAQLCYRQAIKNHLEDENLLNELTAKMKTAKFKKNIVFNTEPEDG